MIASAGVGETSTEPVVLTERGFSSAWRPQTEEGPRVTSVELLPADLADLRRLTKAHDVALPTGAVVIGEWDESAPMDAGLRRSFADGHVYHGAGDVAAGRLVTPTELRAQSGTRPAMLIAVEAEDMQHVTSFAHALRLGAAEWLIAEQLAGGGRIAQPRNLGRLAVSAMRSVAGDIRYPNMSRAVERQISKSDTWPFRVTLGRAAASD